MSTSRGSLTTRAVATPAGLSEISSHPATPRLKRRDCLVISADASAVLSVSQRVGGRSHRLCIDYWRIPKRPRDAACFHPEKHFMRGGTLLAALHFDRLR